MADPPVVSLAQSFQSQLRAADEDAILHMAKRWGNIESRLQSLINSLAQEIAELTAAGEEVPRWKLYEMERYQSLMSAVGRELAMYQQWAFTQIKDNALQAQKDAYDHAKQLAFEHIGPDPYAQIKALWDRLSPEPVEKLTALSQGGAPLNDILSKAYPLAAEAMTQRLLSGAALGWHPRKTAQIMMRGGLDQGLNHILLVARDQQIRNYREATRDAFRKSGVIYGYKRLAAKNDRTCLACLALDGRIYPTSERMQIHPQDRCSMIPLIAGRPEPKWEQGLDWFRKQDEGTQRKMLGTGRFNAWKEREFELKQMVTVKHHPIWGPNALETPLKLLKRGKGGLEDGPSHADMYKIYQGIIVEPPEIKALSIEQGDEQLMAAVLGSSKKAGFSGGQLGAIESAIKDIQKGAHGITVSDKDGRIAGVVSYDADPFEGIKINKIIFKDQESLLLGLQHVAQHDPNKPLGITATVPDDYKADYMNWGFNVTQAKPPNSTIMQLSFLDVPKFVTDPLELGKDNAAALSLTIQEKLTGPEPITFQTGYPIPDLPYIPVDPKKITPETFETLKAPSKLAVDMLPMKEKPGKHISAGIIIYDPHSRKFVVTQPSKGFAGYTTTLPKGTVEEGEDLQTAAVREVYEETGFMANIVGGLGDYEKTTSTNRFYVGVANAGEPWQAHYETTAVHLVSAKDLPKYLGNKVDRKIAGDFLEQYNKAIELGDGDFAVGWPKLEAEKAVHTEARVAQLKHDYAQLMDAAEDEVTVDLLKKAKLWAQLQPPDGTDELTGIKWGDAVKELTESIKLQTILDAEGAKAAAANHKANADLYESFVTNGPEVLDNLPMTDFKELIEWSKTTKGPPDPVADMQAIYNARAEQEILKKVVNFPPEIAGGTKQAIVKHLADTTGAKQWKLKQLTKDQLAALDGKTRGEVLDAAEGSALKFYAAKNANKKGLEPADEPEGLKHIPVDVMTGTKGGLVDWAVEQSGASKWKFKQMTKAELQALSGKTAAEISAAADVAAETFYEAKAANKPKPDEFDPYAIAKAQAGIVPYKSEGDWTKEQHKAIVAAMLQISPTDLDILEDADLDLVCGLSADYSLTQYEELAKQEKAQKLVEQYYQAGYDKKGAVFKNADPVLLDFIAESYIGTVATDAQKAWNDADLYQKSKTIEDATEAEQSEYYYNEIFKAKAEDPDADIHELASQFTIEQIELAKQFASPFDYNLLNRMNAAKILAGHGGKEAQIEAQNKNFVDKFNETPDAAKYELVKMGNPENMEALYKTTNDPQLKDMIGTAHGLGPIGPALVEGKQLNDAWVTFQGKGPEVEDIHDWFGSLTLEQTQSLYDYQSSELYNVDEYVDSALEIALETAAGDWLDDLATDQHTAKADALYLYNKIYDEGGIQGLEESVKKQMTPEEMLAAAAHPGINPSEAKALEQWAADVLAPTKPEPVNPKAALEKYNIATEGLEVWTDIEAAAKQNMTPEEMTAAAAASLSMAESNYLSKWAAEKKAEQGINTEAEAGSVALSYFSSANGIVGDAAVIMADKMTLDDIKKANVYLAGVGGTTATIVNAHDAIKTALSLKENATEDDDPDFGWSSVKTAQDIFWQQSGDPKDAAQVMSELMTVDELKAADKWHLESSNAGNQEHEAIKAALELKGDQPKMPEHPGALVDKYYQIAKAGGVKTEAQFTKGASLKDLQDLYEYQLIKQGYDEGSIGLQLGIKKSKGEIEQPTLESTAAAWNKYTDIFDETDGDKLENAVKAAMTPEEMLAASLLATTPTDKKLLSKWALEMQAAQQGDDELAAKDEFGLTPGQENAAWAVVDKLNETGEESSPEAYQELSLEQLQYLSQELYKSGFIELSGDVDDAMALKIDAEDVYEGEDEYQNFEHMYYSQDMTTAEIAKAMTPEQAEAALKFMKSWQMQMTIEFPKVEEIIALQKAKTEPSMLDLLYTGTLAETEPLPISTPDNTVPGHNYTQDQFATAKQLFNEYQTWTTDQKAQYLKHLKPEAVEAILAVSSDNLKMFTAESNPEKHAAIKAFMEETKAWYDEANYQNYKAEMANMPAFADTDEIAKILVEHGMTPEQLKGAKVNSFSTIEQSLMDEIAQKMPKFDAAGNSLTKMESTDPSASKVQYWLDAVTFHQDEGLGNDPDSLHSMVDALAYMTDFGDTEAPDFMNPEEVNLSNLLTWHLEKNGVYTDYWTAPKKSLVDVIAEIDPQAAYEKLQADINSGNYGGMNWSNMKSTVASKYTAAELEAAGDWATAKGFNAELADIIEFQEWQPHVKKAADPYESYIQFKNLYDAGNSAPTIAEYMTPEQLKAAELYTQHESITYYTAILPDTIKAAEANVGKQFYPGMSITKGSQLEHVQEEAFSEFVIQFGNYIDKPHDLAVNEFSKESPAWLASALTHLLNNYDIEASELSSGQGKLAVVLHDALLENGFYVPGMDVIKTHLIEGKPSSLYSGLEQMPIEVTTAKDGMSKLFLDAWQSTKGMLGEQSAIQSLEAAEPLHKMIAMYQFLESDVYKKEGITVFSDDIQSMMKALHNGIIKDGYYVPGMEGVGEIGPELMAAAGKGPALVNVKSQWEKLSGNYYPEDKKALLSYMKGIEYTGPADLLENFTHEEIANALYVIIEDLDAPNLLYTQDMKKALESEGILLDHPEHVPPTLEPVVYAGAGPAKQAFKPDPGKTIFQKWTENKEFIKNNPLGQPPHKISFQEQAELAKQKPELFTKDELTYIELASGVSLKPDSGIPLPEGVSQKGLKYKTVADLKAHIVNHSNYTLADLKGKKKGELLDLFSAPVIATGVKTGLTLDDIQELDAGVFQPPTGTIDISGAEPALIDKYIAQANQAGIGTGAEKALKYAQAGHHVQVYTDEQGKFLGVISWSSTTVTGKLKITGAGFINDEINAQGIADALAAAKAQQLPLYTWVPTKYDAKYKGWGFKPESDKYHELPYTAQPVGIVGNESATVTKQTTKGPVPFPYGVSTMAEAKTLDKTVLVSHVSNVSGIGASQLNKLTKPELLSLIGTTDPHASVDKIVVEREKIEGFTKAITKFQGKGVDGLDTSKEAYATIEAIQELKPWQTDPTYDEKTWKSLMGDIRVRGEELAEIERNSTPYAASFQPRPRPQLPAKADLPKHDDFPKPDEVRVISSLGGSTGAELVEDVNTGKKYVRKYGNNADHVRTEVYVDEMYRTMGYNVPRAMLYEDARGRPVKLAEYIEDTVDLPTYLRSATASQRATVKAQMKEAFAMDALVGNWDVAGAGGDNILVDKNGTLWRIDNGGSLQFRAQGKKKESELGPEAYNGWVTDLWTMREPASSGARSHSGPIYREMDWYEIMGGASDIVAKADQLIAKVPEAEREVLWARMEHLRDMVETSQVMQRDQLSAQFPDSLHKHATYLSQGAWYTGGTSGGTLKREGSLLERLPKRLRHTGGTTVADEKGRSWDSLRGDNSVTQMAERYMRDNGLSVDFINDYMGAQSGASSRTLPKVMQYFEYQMRGKPEDAYLRDVRGQKRDYDAQARKLGGEEKLVDTIMAWRAFVWVTLRNTPFKYNNREAGYLQLVRTEATDGVKDIDTRRRPQANYGEWYRAGSRGLMDSCSLYRWTRLSNPYDTMMKVPYHRVIGLYFHNRPGSPYQDAFLGDGENEVVANLTGLDMLYVGDHAHSGQVDGAWESVARATGDATLAPSYTENLP